MRKKTIAILFGLGFGLGIIAAMIYVGGIIGIISTAESCSSYSSSYAACDPTTQGGSIGLVLLAGLTALGAGVLSTISWVAILIKQAQRQQWAWFVCTLLFGSICMLIWLIVEPEVSPVPQYAPVYQPAQPAYPPVYPTNGPYPHTSYPPAEQPYYQDPYRPQ